MSIKTRLFLILGLFTSLMVINAAITNWQIRSIENAAQTINMAGRQRMLSQKMTKEKLLIVAGAARQEEFNKTRALFDESLNKLYQSESGDAKAQFKKISAVWERYQTELDSLSLSSPPEELYQLANDSLVLLKESNGAVTMLQANTDAKVSRIKTSSVIFAIIAIICSAVSFWFINSKIIQRIDKIRLTSTKIADERDLSERIDDPTQDELGSTSAAFNQMVDSIAGITTQIHTIETELVQQVNSLQITARDNQSSMDLQRDEIIQVSSAVTQMASTVQEVAQNTQQASDVAKQAQDKGAEGSVLLQDTMNHTQQLASDVAETSQNISELAEASTSIGSIAETISTIAEQTNLLALKRSY